MRTTGVRTIGVRTIGVRTIGVRTIGVRTIKKTFHKWESMELNYTKFLYLGLLEGNEIQHFRQSGTLRIFKVEAN